MSMLACGTGLDWPMPGVPAFAEGVKPMLMHRAVIKVRQETRRAMRLSIGTHFLISVNARSITLM